MKNLKLVFALFFISVGVFAQTKNKIEIDKETFVCPPCDQSCDTITYDTKGNCPKCSKELVSKYEGLIICFYLQDGVELLDFAGPMEVFVNAGFKVFTVSKTKDIITSQNVLKIMPDYSIEDAPYADVMAFFGGGTGSPSKDKALISWIQSRESKTPHIFSVCTGAFIVGRAGLLDNLTATTYYTHIEDLRKILPKTQVLENVRYVDNGNIITTAGISAGIDGALHFVAKIKGIDFAKTIAKEMEYDKWVPEQGLIIENK